MFMAVGAVAGLAQGVLGGIAAGDKARAENAAAIQGWIQENHQNAINAGKSMHKAYLGYLNQTKRNVEIYQSAYDFTNDSKTNAALERDYKRNSLSTFLKQKEGAAIMSLSSRGIGFNSGTSKIIRAAQLLGALRESTLNDTEYENKITAIDKQGNNMRKQITSNIFDVDHQAVTTKPLLQNPTMAMMQGVLGGISGGLGGAAAGGSLSGSIKAGNY